MLWNPISKVECLSQAETILIQATGAILVFPPRPLFAMPGPYYCKSYHGILCDLGSGGGAASIPGRCKHDPRCNEPRCASHCKCARMGWRTGRNRGRLGQAMPKAKAKARVAPLAAPPPPMAAAPIGRMPALSCEVLDVADWYAAMVDSIKNASEVFLGSYQHDHEGLTAVLERRLRGRSAFECVVLLDREMYKGATPNLQRPRLNRLQRAGATIVLCRGTASTGAFHAKAVVIDRRTAFVGSANTTGKSLRNAELCFRLRGPPVPDVLEFLMKERDGGEELE